MNREVKLLIKKLAIFLIPFVIYSLVILVVDPFIFFGLPSPVDDSLKKEISFKLNYSMWKMAEFKKDPVPNILLGDSRMMAMNADSIAGISGDPYYNFSYGGGTLREAIATFHYAHQLVDMENVYIGLTLDTYNGSDTRDRVSEVLAAQKNPLLYLVNNTVSIATWNILKSGLTGVPTRIGKPIGDKDHFWQHQLDTTARVYFSNYIYPTGYRNELQEISEICEAEGIELNFIIFPGHMDLQDKISEFQLEEEDSRFRTDIRQLGRVFDFAWENDLSRDRAQFRDPYHFGPSYRDLIMESIWGQPQQCVRISEKSSP